MFLTFTGTAKKRLGWHALRYSEGRAEADPITHLSTAGVRMRRTIDASSTPFGVPQSVPPMAPNTLPSYESCPSVGDTGKYQSVHYSVLQIVSTTTNGSQVGHDFMLLSG